jgi:tripartite ATP-independent transporter DctM subunit
MEPTLIGLLGFIVLFCLIFACGMPIGLAMALMGFIGISLISGMTAALGSLGIVPYSTVASYVLSVIPTFILMGELAFLSGMMTEAYSSINKWLGHLPGGLAMATIGGCAAFAATCGSSVACATVMVPVAVPEMKKYGYDSKLSLGCIAAGGTLGILIPPSTPMVVYAIFAEQSIGKLFIAGILPGLLLTFLFMLTIYTLSRVMPAMGPPGPKTHWRDRFAAIKGVWLVGLLVILVLGGIWGGIFTPGEAGGIGAIGAFLIALGKKSLTKDNMLQSLENTARTTAMIFTIMIGAMIFNGFLAVTKLPFMLSDFVSGLAVPPTAILVAILFLYLILGCIMDPFASYSLKFRF